MRAARAGVDVRLLLPSHTDSSAALAAQQSHYSELLAAGVRIYERDDGILHSKTVVVDGVWSIVGSSNFDHRSVLFNDEVDAVVISVATGAQLDQYFQQDLQHASAIDRPAGGGGRCHTSCTSSSGGCGSSCCDGADYGPLAAGGAANTSKLRL